MPHTKHSVHVVCFKSSLQWSYMMQCKETLAETVGSIHHLLDLNYVLVTKFRTPLLLPNVSEAPYSVRIPYAFVSHSVRRYGLRISLFQIRTLAEWCRGTLENSINENRAPFIRRSQNYENRDIKRISTISRNKDEGRGKEYEYKREAQRVSTALYLLWNGNCMSTHMWQSKILPKGLPSNYSK